LIVRPREFDCYVLIFDKTDFLEPRPEFGNLSRRNFRGSGGQESNDWRPRLLRTRRERPCSHHAAEQGDEVAPLHCPMPPVLSTEKIAHLGTAGDCRAAAFQSSLCRSWVLCHE
jgi:hypothetical protein